MSEAPKTIWVLDAAGSDDPEQCFWTCEPPGWQSPDPWPPRDRVTTYVPKAAFDRLLARMVRISQYSPPEEIREGDSYGEWGVDAGEAIEMAYDNVLEEARAALAECGVKVDV
ncbi:MAG: hypothetical protein F4Y04_06670 [Chloroflexi bacterium]|nr:hypothetical protein [Chloroflexota bacterium]